jgi:phosphate butyryltransferase
MVVNFAEIVAGAQRRGKKRLILIPAQDERIIKVVSDAVKSDLIIPIFVGDEGMVEELLKGTSISPRNYKIVDKPDHRESLSTALSMIKEDRGDILMQGAVPHQFFVDAIQDRENGILRGSLTSFVSLFEMPQRDRLVMVTDSYVNNFPTLAEKKTIVENAVRLANILGIRSLRIAALAAVEQINPAIPSTLDAAVLSKMSGRKQFGDVTIEGPLDIDCAVSEKAAARKGVSSIVTGNVDIYLAPDIEAGYSLSQLLVFIGRMPMAGVLMGTSRPVILDLPFVSIDNKLTEIAIAVLLCDEDG